MHTAAMLVNLNGIGVTTLSALANSACGRRSTGPERAALLRARSLFLRKFFSRPNADVADPVFLVREPHVAVRPRDDQKGLAVLGDPILSDFSPGRKAADLSPLVLAKPDVAVRSGGNADRAAFGRGDIELRHVPFHRHPPDLVRSPLGEPESAVRAEADAPGSSGTDLSMFGSRELGDLALRGDPAELLKVVFREPEGPIGPGDDAVGTATFGGNGELGNVALGRDLPDLVTLQLGEPEVAVGSKSKITRERLRGGDRKLGELPRKRHGPDGI